MEPPETAAPHETDAGEGFDTPGSHLQGEPGAGAAPPEQQGRLTKYLEKAKRALERAGFPVSTPGSEAAPSAPGDGATAAAVAAVGALDAPGGAPLERSAGSDEAVSRVGVTSLVETAERVAVQIVGSRGVAMVGASDAQQYAERVKMTPAIKESMIASGVEVARVENVNVPPHLTLTVLFTGWLYGIYGVCSDMKADAKERDGKKETPK